MPTARCLGSDYQLHTVYSRCQSSAPTQHRTECSWPGRPTPESLEGYLDAVEAANAGRGSVPICLELKKSLVDLGIVDLSQEQFDGYLYRIMRVFGCVISGMP